jgi:hypothetical protein
MSSTIAITVILCTDDVPLDLSPAVASLKRQSVQGAWELIPIQNPCSQARIDMTADTNLSLPIRRLPYLECDSDGPIRALREAKGHLIALLNDRINIGPTWLMEIVRASSEYPKATVFCGPITAQLPPFAPRWLADSIFGPVAFAGFAPWASHGLVRGVLSPSAFAALTTAFTDFAPRDGMGLSTAEDPNYVAMDLLERISHRAFAFVAGATATYEVGVADIEPPRLFRRAFRMGRYVAKLRKSMRIPDKYELIGRSPSHGLNYFDKSMCLNFLYGQICELDLLGVTTQCRLLHDVICELGWLTDRVQLSDLAVFWLANRLEYLPPDNNAVSFLSPIWPPEPSPF